MAVRKWRTYMALGVAFVASGAFADSASPVAESGGVGVVVQGVPAPAKPTHDYTVIVPAEVDLLGIGGVVLTPIEIPRSSVVTGSFYFRFEGDRSPSGDKYLVKLCDGEFRRRGKGEIFNEIECGLYESKLTIAAENGISTITFADSTYNADYQPNKLDLLRLLGGKSMIGHANISHLINFFNTHTVQKTGEVYVPYPPESVKANFDRKFKRDASTNASHSSVLKKFKGRYVFYNDNKMSVIGGLEFYPNKNGTMIEYHLVGDVSVKDLTTVDWRGVFPKAIQDVERIGSL